jgi:hypothetical protein
MQNQTSQSKKTKSEKSANADEKFGKLAKKKKLLTTGVKKVIGGLGGKQHNEIFICS